MLVCGVVFCCGAGVVVVRVVLICCGGPTNVVLVIWSGCRAAFVRLCFNVVGWLGGGLLVD